MQPGRLHQRVSRRPPAAAGDVVARLRREEVGQSPVVPDGRLRSVGQRLGAVGHRRGGAVGGGEVDLAEVLEHRGSDDRVVEHRYPSGSPRVPVPLAVLSSSSSMLSLLTVSCCWRS